MMSAECGLIQVHQLLMPLERRTGERLRSLTVFTRRSMTIGVIWPFFWDTVPIMIKPNDPPIRGHYHKFFRWRSLPHPLGNELRCKDDIALIRTRRNRIHSLNNIYLSWSRSIVCLDMTECKMHEKTCKIFVLFHTHAIGRSANFSLMCIINCLYNGNIMLGVEVPAYYPHYET